MCLDYIIENPPCQEGFQKNLQKFCQRKEKALPKNSKVLCTIPLLPHIAAILTFELLAVFRAEDAKTGQQLANVELSIIGTSYKVKTNEEGWCEMNIPLGATVQACCPGYETEKHQFNHLRGNEVQGWGFFLNKSIISCIRLLFVLKYFALNKFQNCNITNVEKKTPNS